MGEVHWHAHASSSISSPCRRGFFGICNSAKVSFVVSHAAAAHDLECWLLALRLIRGPWLRGGAGQNRRGLHPNRMRG